MLVPGNADDYSRKSGASPRRNSAPKNLVVKMEKLEVEPENKQLMDTVRDARLNCQVSCVMRKRGRFFRRNNTATAGMSFMSKRCDGQAWFGLGVLTAG